MEIKFNTKIENPNELANIIGCNISELEGELEKICTASFNEYIDMFQGTKAFKRGSDILEYRLFLLIKYYLMVKSLMSSLLAVYFNQRHQKAEDT